MTKFFQPIALSDTIFFVKRILLLRTFARWKEKNGLSDWALAKAVAEMEQGLIDADLGGYVFKKRVAFPGL